MNKQEFGRSSDALIEVLQNLRTLRTTHFLSANLPVGITSPAIGDKVLVRGRMIRSSCFDGTVCNVYPTMNVTFLQVQDATAPIAPLVRLVAPSVIDFHRSRTGRR